MPFKTTYACIIRVGRQTAHSALLPNNPALLLLTALKGWGLSHRQHLTDNNSHLFTISLQLIYVSFKVVLVVVDQSYTIKCCEQWTYKDVWSLRENRSAVKATVTGEIRMWSFRLLQSPGWSEGFKVGVRQEQGWLWETVSFTRS